jgi:ABC-type multidrug transport system fused ATPase/permease subunit
MPPQAFFRPHGSLDSDDVEIKGDEFVRVLRYFRRRRLYWLAIVLACIGGCCPLATQFVMSGMLSVISGASFTSEDLSFVTQNIIIMGIIHCIVMPANFGARAYANPAFMCDIRRELYVALMAKDVSFFDITPTGILISRLSQDVTLLFQVYMDKSLQALQLSVQAIAGMIMALVTMWQVGLPCLGVVGICCGIYLFGEHILDKLWDEYNENSSFATSKAEEVITSFRTIKSFDNERYEAENFRASLQKVDSVFDKTSLAQGTKDAIIWSLVNCTIAGLLYFGSWFIIKHPEQGYQSGDILLLMMSVLFASLGISQGLSLSDDFKKAGVSAAKILKILETLPIVDQREGGTMDEVQGKIEFVDVGFKYETREEWAVRHLTFTVEPGETVALIGESGCGKSTTLQLIQRFYEVQEGKILLDGIDISTLSPRFVRSKIAIVPQGPILFSMSVIDNIRFAKRDATEDEVAESARIGNAHDFIMELPDLYNTSVQQTSLSGGQKQRICISRAILANAPILLLDEATAALDTESEQLVQQSLETFRQGKTAILVAHRLATVRNANRIIVFKDGHVEETGTHDALLAQNGLYSDLIRFQLQ